MSYTYFGNHQGDWVASASYRARDTVINAGALYRAKAPHTAGGSFSSDAAFWDKLSVTNEETQDLVGAMVTGNTETGITVTYDDASGKLNFSVSGGGGYTQEQIEDFVGAMVTGNTETNITVTYDDTAGKLNFVASTAGYTQEEIEDFIGAMVTGNTETGITVTYDDAGGKLNFAVATQLTTEDIQDIVGGMVSGNSETAIAVTYDDSSGKLDFSVTPGSLDIDSFSAASTPLDDADVFIVSQGGTEKKVSYADISTGGGVSNPYGLLSDPGALDADEFDDGSIDSDWILVQPGSGTITPSEGNHKLSLSCGTTSDLGMFVRPLSTFGGAWADSVTILEAQVQAGRGSGIVRSNFCVTDGASLSSNALQINYSVNDSAPALVYTFYGSANSPFGGGNTQLGSAADFIRVRIVAAAAGTLKFQISTNGAGWRDLNSAISIGFVPTHVGFLFGSNGWGAMSSDYVRRIA